MMIPNAAQNMRSPSQHAAYRPILISIPSYHQRKHPSSLPPKPHHPKPPPYNRRPSVSTASTNPPSYHHKQHPPIKTPTTKQLTRTHHRLQISGQKKRPACHPTPTHPNEPYPQSQQVATNTTTPSFCFWLTLEYRGVLGRMY